MVIASILRLGGHGEHDDGKYVPDELKHAKVGADCMKLAEQQILNEGLATPQEMEEWRATALLQVQEAVATAQREPAPDPDIEEWQALSTRHLSDGYEPAP
jgi:pyruvate dehydrogenase E1 component alpha subunit/2-oxoisovalerate dehydrogenase E1 component alpha subunit